VNPLLGVAFVLTGRVTVRGDSFSIDAELIDTTDGACVWGKRFDRSVAEMQTTQDEIAAAISTQLRVKLSPSEDRRLKQRQPVDREAYRLYLLGRFWWNKRPQEGFMKALDFFQKAIDYDPLFALPYSGIADAYTTNPRTHEHRAPAERRADVEHRFLPVAHDGKLDALVRELRHEERGLTLVFVRTKRGADRLVKRLGWRLNKREPSEPIPGGAV